MATAGSRLAASTYNEDTKKLIALGRRGTDSSITTASSPQTPVMRLPGVALKLGYTYEVEVGCHLKSSIASDIIKVSIHFTIDGTTPTVSSAVLPGGSFSGNTSTNTAHQNSHVWRVPYTPTADIASFQVLIGIGRIGGTGNCILEADGDYETLLKIYSVGLAVSDTGVDL